MPHILVIFLHETVKSLTFTAKIYIALLKVSHFRKFLASEPWISVLALYFSASRSVRMPLRVRQASSAHLTRAGMREID